MVEAKGNNFPVDILNFVPSRHLTTLFLDTVAIDFLGLTAVEYLPTATEKMDETTYGLCFNFLCEYRSGKIEKDKFKWVELEDNLLSQFQIIKCTDSFVLLH